MLDTLPRRAERHRKARNRRRGIVGFFAFLIILALIAAPVGWFWRSIGASGPQDEVVLTIPQGSTGNDIAELLEDEGVIRSAFAFKLLARIRGVSLDGYKAGDYEVATNMSAGAAIEALDAGPLLVRGVAASFPEGLRIEQVADRASELLGVNRKGLIKAARSGDYTLPPWLPDGTKTVEGFLFPSTYEFPEDEEINGADVIRRLLLQFEREAEDLPWENAEALGVTPYEAVVIASMIEREARFPEDRANISAVIYNRLAEGMALQIDATVQYALGDWEPITLADREIDSPHNTYQNTGLPPTPIASPGRASLEAALNPADVDYLYYVVIDAQGHHAFTASYDEFLRLVDQYQG